MRKIIKFLVCLLAISMFFYFFGQIHVGETQQKNNEQSNAETNAEETTDIEYKIEENIELNHAEEAVQNTEITITFVGDLLLASANGKTTSGSFNDVADKNDTSYFMKNVMHIFENDDFTIGNLENVFTDSELKESAKSGSVAYWFRSKTKNAAILPDSSIEGVSLANNHTKDYGEQGLKDTISAVVANKTEYGTNEKIMYFEKDGFKIAVICHGLWGEYQANEIVKKVKIAEEQSDYQIVFFHGGTEKIHKPEEWKQRAARKLVDGGADLVIGNHPHVLQPKEVYKGVDIIYSIGNFCFGGNRYPENRTIIYQMRLTVGKNKTIEESQSNIIPCYLYTSTVNNYQPVIIEEENKDYDKVIAFMEGKRASPL